MRPILFFFFFFSYVFDFRVPLHSFFVDFLRCTSYLTRVPRVRWPSAASPSAHPLTSRRDNYWTAFILTPLTRTFVDVQLTLISKNQPNKPSVSLPRSFSPGERSKDAAASEPASLLQLQAVKLTGTYEVYGSRGLERRHQDIILPLSFPRPISEVQAEPLWQPSKGHEEEAQCLPIRTHLLCHLDDPVSTVDTYAGGVIREGDVIVLQESALAAMQGRFRSPRNIRPGLLARLACMIFKPASSLATACGMQALIDLVGRVRVAFALVLGTILRLVGLKGAFYLLAGPQVRDLSSPALRPHFFPRVSYSSPSHP